MVLRKPYAFLIKHFQKINLVLLLLVLYVFVKHMQAYNFVKDYISTGVYSALVDPISNYVSFLVFLACGLIIVFAIILMFLLYHKKKPVVVYGLIILEYIATLICLIYTSVYFNGIGDSTIVIRTAMLVRDILFISQLPQYVVIVLLGIRSLGLDLKKFGFEKDEEFQDISEEDREEFEVNVEFDKDVWKRKYREKVRHLRYFFVEHKTVLTVLIIVIVIALSGFGYYHFFIVNKVYGLGEKFTSGSFQMSVNHLYFTDSDSVGNPVTVDNKRYMVLELSIHNTSNRAYQLDTSKFILSTNKGYYIPVSRYDSAFVDLGNGYQNEEVKPDETVTYLLIYEINPVDYGAKFTLYYREFKSTMQSKLRKFKIEVTDLTGDLEMGTSQLGEEMKVTLPAGDSIFTISNYQMADSMNYYYERCYVYSCPTLTGTIVSTSYGTSYTVLALDIQSSMTMSSLRDFMVKYGKIRYEVDGTLKEGNMANPLSTSWKGNKVYLLVPKEAMNATSIELQFSIRNQIYHYILKKGE